MIESAFCSMSQNYWFLYLSCQQIWIALQLYQQNNELKICCIHVVTHVTITFRTYPAVNVGKDVFDNWVFFSILFALEIYYI